MRGPLAAAFLALVATAAAGPAPSTTDAMVFIRAIGEVRAEYEQGWKQTVEKRDVEIATGSGFVVSPSGYVLTSQHVLSGTERTVDRDGHQVKVSAEVKTIEVVFPTDGRRLVATVTGSDPDLDLAVLSVPAVDLPSVPLGDSDALEPGQAVEVVGFPMGRDVEVGRRVTAETIPQASVSRGSVSALRASDGGEPRYIQTDATINPGSSGGPVLDEDGYAVGVVRMKLRPATGVGFAVPINLVKDFLEASGLERVFPGRRLRLGPLQSFDWKAIRLRTAEALPDVSPARLRVDTGGAPEEVTLRVDRVFTPFVLADLERELLSGAFRDPAVSPARHRVARLGSRSAVLGSARGAQASGDPVEMEYAILDLGTEKLVARYAAPAAQVAFNRSVLRASLESVEADALLTAELKALVATASEPAVLPGPDAPAIVMPKGWPQEPNPPPGCRGLSPVDSALSASPNEDFTVTFRAGWRSRGPAPEDAAAACAGGGPRAGTVTYALGRERLGVSYERHGVFLRHGDGLLQLEVDAPPSKFGFVRDLFAAWVNALSSERKSLQ